MEDLGQEESEQMGQPEKGLQCIFGERPWWGSVLTAVPLAWPCQAALPSLESLQPLLPHLLGNCPSSVTLGVLGETELLLSARCPLDSAPHPLPLGSLERTRHGTSVQSWVEGASCPSLAPSVML